MTVEPAVMMLLEEIRQRVVAQSVLLIAIFLMLTAALLALLMKWLYRRLEALITEIMVNGYQHIFYEKTGDTVPERGLSNPDSIFPAVVAVPAEVVDRLDELLADTTGEPATDSKQAEPQPTMGKVEQVIRDEQPTSSLSEPEISGADTNDKVKPEPKSKP